MSGARLAHLLAASLNLDVVSPQADAYADAEVWAPEAQTLGVPEDSPSSKRWKQMQAATGAVALACESVYC